MPEKTEVLRHREISPFEEFLDGVGISSYPELAQEVLSGVLNRLRFERSEGGVPASFKLDEIEEVRQLPEGKAQGYAFEALAGYLDDHTTRREIEKIGHSSKINFTVKSEHVPPNFSLAFVEFGQIKEIAEGLNKTQIIDPTHVRLAFGGEMGIRQLVFKIERENEEITALTPDKLDDIRTRRGALSEDFYITYIGNPA